jgi:hypothetical protein
MVSVVRGPIRDPLTGRQVRFRKTRETEVKAQIELGTLLGLARASCRTCALLNVRALWLLVTWLGQVWKA